MEIELLEDQAMWQCINALGIKPLKGGKRWIFIYDDVRGSGDTIYAAARDFYFHVRTKTFDNTW